jgi:hypothetical protein
MTFKVGDTIRVVNAHTMHSGLEGKEGKVVGADDTSQACRVHLKWKSQPGLPFEVEGVLTTLFHDEMELVEAADESKQIGAIVKALLGEVRNADWTPEQAHEVATNLYKAGCRHEG